jgi:hypothetical protein
MKTTSKDGAVRSMRYFRASDAEWEFMQAVAAEHEMSVSELIRDCLLVDMPITREAEPTGDVGNTPEPTPRRGQEVHGG